MTAPEIARQLGETITQADIIVSLAGIVVLGVWFIKGLYGPGHLANSRPRRNNMPVYLPLVPLFVCFLTIPAAVSIKNKLLPNLPQWQSVFIDNLLLCAGAIGGIVIIIFIARRCFARRLKGFGLNIKTIPGDLPTAVLNLICILPLVTLVLLATIFVGKLLYGADFQINPHTELELITANPQLSVRLIIILTAGLVMPIFEELLFRGLFQTIIRSFVKRPWISILANSVLFAMVHQNSSHWPALFVLSVCLGYSFEKSGSLFRPIFIHCIFNTASIIGTLMLNSQ